MHSEVADQRDRVKQYFSALSGVRRPCYEAAVARRADRFLRIMKDVLETGSNVLDFGCGTGEIAFSCARAGFRVTGYDISTEAIAEARRRHAHSLVTFCQPAPRSVIAVPLPDQSFDAAICSSVLEYSSSPGEELGEICRLLRPGGWLFATVPNPWHPIRWLEGVARETLQLVPAEFRQQLLSEIWRRRLEYLQLSVARFSLGQWRFLLEQAGFRMLQLSKRYSPLWLLIARKGESVQPVRRGAAQL